MEELNWIKVYENLNSLYFSDDIQGNYIFMIESKEDDLINALVTAIENVINKTN